MDKQHSIQAVLLDVGQVIVELDFPRLLRTFEIPTSNTESEAFRKLANWPAYDKFERGELTPETFKSEMEGFLNRSFSWDQFRSAWNQIFVGTVEGVPELLSEIGEKVPVYGLTNSNPLHIEYCLASYRCLSDLKQLFTSFDLRARKPEAAIFHKAADKMGVSLQNVLFVDDHEANLEGARKLGMAAELCYLSAQRLREIATRYVF